MENLTTTKNTFQAFSSPYHSFSDFLTGSSGPNGASLVEDQARNYLSETFPPYPCSKESVTLQQVFKPVPIPLILRKCSCWSTWCPTCSRLGGGSLLNIKKRMEALGLLGWRRIRHVFFTVNRDLYPGGGEEAFRDVTERKLITQLIWNLKRTAKIGILDWIWILEWHKDGFPHWHLFIAVEKSGKGGMIGGDLLRKYWIDESCWVKEGPIKSEAHWQALLGDFQKTGYFSKDKAHQGRLPEWAKDYEKRIRRFGSAVLPIIDGERRKIEKFSIEKVEQKRRTYRTILEGCGKKTRISISNHMLNVNMLVSVPYKSLKAQIKRDGEYIKGKGFMVEVDRADLCLLAEIHNGLIPLAHEIIAQEDIYRGLAFDKSRIDFEL